MSQEKFDELFKGYPEGMDELRKAVHLAIHNSHQEMKRAIEELSSVTAPTSTSEVYPYVGIVNHLEVWQVKSSPMELYDTFFELIKPLTDAFDVHCKSVEKREGILRRKHKPTPAELLTLRDAALEAATALEKWLRSIHPAEAQL